MSAPLPPPRHWTGMIGHLGPGLIISAVIVGSGELIVTPKLGASVGFDLLWFIILGCLIKVFVQIELGRYAVSEGITTLQAMNSIPGPRFRVSWLLWLWLIMFFCLIFQVAGMVGGLASVFRLAGMPLPQTALAIGVGAVTALLLVAGRYRLVERFSTTLVVLFTFTTLLAVGALQTTEFAMTSTDLARGFSFHVPGSFTTAFAAFGIIGVGASELIYYPYWCLEKGYARHVGAHENTPDWYDRARGWMRVMQFDAWVSFALYTTATLAFYILGAAVLKPKGLVVEDSRMIETLSHMYRETFGPWSYWLFLVGAFAVLFSTVFGATASNARLFADALNLFGFTHYNTPEDRVRMVKVGCVALPIAFTSVFLFFGAPVSLVFVGALAQGLMLPFLAGSALYFHHARTRPELRSSPAWTAFLWLAALSMVSVGIYQVVQEIAKRLP